MMTSLLDLRPTDKVVEVGTGCGYQSAVLAELAARVVTVEIVPELARAAEATLDGLGYRGRVSVRLAADRLGWPAEALPPTTPSSSPPPRPRSPRASSRSSPSTDVSSFPPARVTSSTSSSWSRPPTACTSPAKTAAASPPS